MKINIRPYVTRCLRTGSFLIKPRSQLFLQRRMSVNFTPAPVAELTP